MPQIPQAAPAQAGGLKPADGDLTLVKVKRKPTDAQWKEYPARTVESLPGFAAKAASIPLSRFGGRLDRKANATGFFHAGRWWLVDPEGGLFLSVGINSVSVGRTATSQAALEKKFGTLAQWAERETQRLKAAGFNTAGCWSDAAQLRQGHRHPPIRTLRAAVGADGGPEPPSLSGRRLLR